MVRIVIDAEMRRKLHDLTQEAELCDETGNVLARLLPATANGHAEPPISAEELQRRRQSNEWYTTAEVLAHLEKL